MFYDVIINTNIDDIHIVINKTQLSFSEITISVNWFMCTINAAFHYDHVPFIPYNSYCISELVLSKRFINHFVVVLQIAHTYGSSSQSCLYAFPESKIILLF